MSKDLRFSNSLNIIDKELISPVQLETFSNVSTSSSSTKSNDFLKSLFNASSSKPNASFFELNDKLGNVELKALGSDTYTLRSWKNIENISARLIDYYDDVVVLECLVDREFGVYEEREFRASLFAGYELQIGNLFYLRFFDRENETKMEIHNDRKLTSNKDFPKKDFTELFKESKLFKK